MRWGKADIFFGSHGYGFVNFLLRPPDLVIFFLRLVGKQRTNRGLNPEMLVFSCVFCWLKWSKKGALSLSLYDSFGAWLCGRFMDSRSPRKKRSTQGEAWARLGDFLDDWLVEHVDSLWVRGKLNLSESSPLLWLYHQCYNVDINGWPTCCMVSLLGVVIKSMRPPGGHHPVHSWFHVESARLICRISWFQCRILMNFGSVKPLDEHL